ncbi:helix-turn-helix transcriptional regulator [Paenibacillus qinlingensis]|uniref:Transcriptional regulator with XRE-family HTH domain n=1 Tax=Paenibacillus qinlingensis TaxID=1837343 RepID=A0ABU1NN26_9BACL|nr:helix-turn-helix transcriptional regulator [Paenibacillus qinlingensis]MDR6548860.1 transcriptional regulator with XRE-family HTH domain [Paenibacillus qinlingensis]
MMKQFEGFGKFLESLRGKMSLREAANKSGLSHAYIRDLELERNRSTNEKIKPSPVTLKKLSDAYKFSYTDLMEKAGYLEKEDQETQATPLTLPLLDILFIEIGPTEMTYHTRIGSRRIHMQSLLDFSLFLDQLEDHGFKKMDTDLFVNLTHVKKYDAQEGKLYFDPLGVSLSVTIAALRQKKYHELILRSVARHAGNEIEFNYEKSLLKESLLQPLQRQN